MKDRNDDLTIDDNIRWLKTEIEKSAPIDPEGKKWREKFYQKLGQFPKGDQRDVLIQILGSQIASSGDSRKALRLQGDEEIQFREKVRKRHEYVLRCLKQGKTPKKSPLDNIWLPPNHPPHRKKDISSLNLWDLYVALKRAGISSQHGYDIYKTIHSILEYFLNVFIEFDSIKRELIRIRKDPYTKEYVEFKVRSKKTSKSP